MLTGEEWRREASATSRCMAVLLAQRPAQAHTGYLTRVLRQVPALFSAWRPLRGSLRSTSTLPGTERQSFILWLLHTAPCLSPAIAGHKPTGRCSSLFNIGEWACTEQQPSTKPQLSLNSAKIIQVPHTLENMADSARCMHAALAFRHKPAWKAAAHPLPPE